MLEFQMTSIRCQDCLQWTWHLEFQWKLHGPMLFTIISTAQQAPHKLLKLNTTAGKYIISFWYLQCSVPLKSNLCHTWSKNHTSVRHKGTRACRTEYQFYTTCNTLRSSTYYTWYSIYIHRTITAYFPSYSQ